MVMFTNSSTGKLKKLPPRYNAIIMPLVLSILMSCIVSGISTHDQHGILHSLLRVLDGCLAYLLAGGVS
ncbi:hypothetical protein [Halomonas elongata]|uniref:hypothetical protein n=1 Tax=Halomonas elongata TaxID=2746 RepID=UPI001CEC7E11|nr:hypothetical protein [Halomonas elongata]